MVKKDGDREEELLRRDAHYGLIAEHLQDLLVLSSTLSERKALGILFYLLKFLQGKRKFPGKDEISEIIGDCLDRNLGIDEFSKKWNLSKQRIDPGVDNPEEYYLDMLQKLQLLQQIREGWNGWTDGSYTKSELAQMEEDQQLRNAYKLVEASNTLGRIDHSASDCSDTGKKNFRSSASKRVASIQDKE